MSFARMSQGIRLSANIKLSNSINSQPTITAKIDGKNLPTYVTQNKNTTTKNLIYLGENHKLNGDYIMGGYINYYRSDYTSSDNGTLKSTNLIISLSNGTFESVPTIVEFDSINNIYPTSVLVDGNNYSVTGSRFLIPPIKAISISINISNLNKGNSPLIIRNIYAKHNYVVDIRNIISMSFSINERSDLNLPNYGIISNVGNIEFYDNDKTILLLAENLRLEKGLDCYIYLNFYKDGDAEFGEIIAKYYTDQWSYDNENFSVSLSLKDDLEEWQDINVEKINYDPRVPQSQPMSYFYKYLYNITVSKGYSMVSYNELDQDTKYILDNIFVQYPLLKNGTLWQQWTKLCQACQLHIYKDNGVIQCKYSGGN
jgi:hypothetical protein